MDDYRIEIFNMSCYRVMRGSEQMNGQTRANIRAGLEVDIVLKQDQRSGKLTRGVVKDILTNSPNHPHGIKVRLVSGHVGRVKHIIAPSS